jgi:hypothetical protein
MVFRDMGRVAAAGAPDGAQDRRGRRNILSSVVTVMNKIDKSLRQLNPLFIH